MRHNALYETVQDPHLGEVRTVRYPAIFDGAPRRAAFTAPLPGADLAEVATDWQLPWEGEGEELEG